MLSRWCKVLSFYSCLVVVAKYVIFSYFQIPAAAAHHVSTSTNLVKAKICFSKYQTLKTIEKMLKL